MKGSEKGGEKEGQENWKVDISFKEKKKDSFIVQTSMFRERLSVYTLHYTLHCTSPRLVMAVRNSRRNSSSGQSAQAPGPKPLVGLPVLGFTCTSSRAHVERR